MAVVDWSLIPFAEHRAETHMALDHFIASNYHHFNRPILRFYTWKPWAVSIGYHQKWTDLDIEKLRANGYDWVRRATGGRAIFHARELTYSVIVPTSEWTRQSLYKDTHECFVSAFATLGVDSDYAPGGTPLASVYRQPSGLACFSASARFEVQRYGRKLIGSAQRVYPDAILQHGSIMLGPEHLNIVSYLALPETEKDRLRSELEQGTEYLDLVTVGTDMEELVNAIIREFQTRFQIRTFKHDVDIPTDLSAWLPGHTPRPE